MSDNVARQKQFKNTGRHEEMRRRRAEGSLELRKQRKEEQLMKRRNVDIHDQSTDDESIASGASGDHARKPIDARLMTLLESYKTLHEGADADRRLVAVESIRRHLSRAKNPPIDEVIKMGLIPYLVKALNDQESSKIQFEAAWALTNITSGNSVHTAAAVNEGVIAPLVQFMGSLDNQVAEQCAWALGNIVGESAAMRDVVLEQGIVGRLIGLAQRPGLSIECIRTLAWTLSNLCRYKVPQVEFSVLAQIAPVLAILIHHPDTDVACDTCWALAYISDGSEDRIDLVLKIGVLDRLVQLATVSEPRLVAPALRTLGNIVTGDDNQTQSVINCGVLKTVLPTVLTSTKSSLAREGCWLASNICAGNSAQIQTFLDSGLIGLIIHLLDKGDYRVQVEASWVIYNVCSGGSTEQAHVLLQCGALTAICRLLKVTESRVLTVVLDTLAMLLGVAAKIGSLEEATLLVEECEGLDHIEKLQNHENEDVYQKALQLVERYFSEEVGTDDVGVDDGAIQFQNPSTGPVGGFSF